MEILDIVDEHDHIIGQAPYEEVHREKLLHRVVHAIIINDAGEVLLQLRSEHKSAFPLHWSFSVGGHVRHGETYEKALLREAKEEAGIMISNDMFIPKGDGTYTDELGHRVLYKTFQVHYDGPIESKNNEVAAMQFVTWNVLNDMIVSKKEKIQPEFIATLQKHWGKELTRGFS